jgi:hypothetical protein
MSHYDRFVEAYLWVALVLGFLSGCRRRKCAADTPRADHGPGRPLPARPSPDLTHDPLGEPEVREAFMWVGPGGVAAGWEAAQMNAGRYKRIRSRGPPARSITRSRRLFFLP